ncbi:hypothetical protein [Pseudomonas sp. zfem005]|uniref:PA0613 family protein n=1 Tax=Pseudomonas sp. zfem005 TaxID=3078200 RepID=UPI0029298A2A|nr:hypothetical protein [Pseudomonas sp. zfem005]MDU9415204.1 hypothetical protein [Pseudomonas sp. zfem005]
MIAEMDEMLKLWARDMHGPDGVATGSGSVLGRLMDCGGEMIRGSGSRSRMLLPWSADIELIVNKHLDFPLRQVVHEHYVARRKHEFEKWSACGCGRTQFYERLHSAHVAIAGMLLERAA